jgi:site-specific DNA-methyltransferase (adenine-specific)
MINTLLHGDCLDALAGLPDVSARLIYLDPPFNTQVRRNAAAGAYDDALGGAADYVAFMQPRVEQMRRVLVADGSLFFHCDWRMRQGDEKSAAVCLSTRSCGAMVSVPRALAVSY